MNRSNHDIAIIGGGYSGVATSIHLSRTAQSPLRIAIVDPNSQPGRGLAYRDVGSQYRLNGPAANHGLYPDDPSHFQQWYLRSGLLQGDQELEIAPGVYFPRRAHFGAYLTTEFASHASENPSKTEIIHIMNRAVDAQLVSGGWEVTLGDGTALRARLLVIAATPGHVSVPRAFDSLAPECPAFLESPWNHERINQISRDANVLILGMAQTASDVAATLLKRGHSGQVNLISRRGLSPRKRPEFSPDTMPEQNSYQPGSISEFVDLNGNPIAISRILRLLRGNARMLAQRGQSWVPVMENIRNSAPELWPNLGLSAKSRFLRHARSWYDVHRFRLPPQIERLIEAGRESGQLIFEAAVPIASNWNCNQVEVTIRRRGVKVIDTRKFDAVINCTGLSGSISESGNPILESLLERGIIRPHATGNGIDVDIKCRAINAYGQISDTVFAVGPLTYGSHIDQQGSVFIVQRLLKVIPIINSLLSRNTDDH